MKKIFGILCAICLLLTASVPALAAQTQRCPYSNEPIDPVPIQSFNFYMEPGESYFRVAVYNAMPETDGNITVRIFKNGGKHPYTSFTVKPGQWTPKDSVFQASPGDSFMVMLLTSQTVKANGTLSVRVSPTDFSPSTLAPEAEPTSEADVSALAVEPVAAPVQETTDNPYFDQSAYMKPTDVFSSAEILVDEQEVSDLSDVCFSVNNVCYIPLRQTLRACGFDDADIIWDSGKIFIQVSAGTLELQVGSDAWTLDGETHQARNGHVRLKGATTYIPKDMIDEWNVTLGKSDSRLSRLKINAYYTTPSGGGLIVH